MKSNLRNEIKSYILSTGFKIKKEFKLISEF